MFRSGWRSACMKWKYFSEKQTGLWSSLLLPKTPSPLVMFTSRGNSFIWSAKVSSVRLALLLVCTQLLTCWHWFSIPLGHALHWPKAKRSNLALPVALRTNLVALYALCFDDTLTLGRFTSSLQRTLTVFPSSWNTLWCSKGLQNSLTPCCSGWALKIQLIW